MIESTDADSTDKNPTGQLPFFVSGGADSMLKVYEHNPYMPVPEDDKKDLGDSGDEKKFKSLKSDELDLAAFKAETNVEEKQKLLA